MLQTLSVVHIFSFVIPSLAAVLTPLERRDPATDDATTTSAGFGTCLSVCAWAEPVTNCATTDLPCFCSVFSSAGLQAVPCVSCLQTPNPTLASDIEVIAQYCVSTTAASLTPSTAHATQTPPPTTVVNNVCGVQCSNIDVAMTSCINDACFCPTLLVSGAECSSCWATENVTAANDIGSAISICISENDTTQTYTTSTAAIQILTTVSATSNPFSSSPSNPVLSPSSKSSLSSGAIAGVAVGAIIGVLLVALVGFIFYRQWRTSQIETSAMNHPYPHGPQEHSSAKFDGPRNADIPVTRVTTADVPSGRLRYLDEDPEDTGERANAGAGARCSTNY
jgi:hypothetical protein